MKSRFPSGLVGALPAAALALTPLFAAPTPLEATQHWDHMPIRVSFAPSRAATPERVSAAAAGFAEWSAASGGVIWYSVVDRLGDADVVVKFVPAKSVSEDVSRVGETDTAARGGVLKRADIRLATGDTTLSQVQEEAAHEWGHALGIAGHSVDPNDLMYASTTRIYDVSTGEYRPTPMRTVSAADLQAIERAYPRLFQAAKTAESGR